MLISVQYLTTVEYAVIEFPFLSNESHYFKNNYLINFYINYIVLKINYIII